MTDTFVIEGRHLNSTKKLLNQVLWNVRKK